MGNVTRILTALLLIVAVAGLLVWLVFRARGQEPVGEPPAAAETPSLAVSEIRQEETRAGEVPAGGDTHPVRVPTGDTQPVITTPQEQPPPMWIPEEEQPEPGLEPGVGQEPAGEADTVRTLLESAESQPVPRADLAETQGDTAPVTIEELTGAEPGMAGTVPAASEATAAGEEAVPSVEAGEATPTGEAAAYQPGSPVYQLAAIRGIGTDYAEQLAAIGITTPGELLEQGATPRGRQAIVEQSGISGRLILEWVNYVDLFRVNGVTSEYADLLAAAGVDTLVELAMSNPDSLQRSLAALNESRQLLGEPPTPSLVKEWVEQAKNLPRKIYY
jgi:predicted flap endonuclease-1-like 5' DNA nuclease